MYSEMLVFAAAFVVQMWLVSSYFPRQMLQRVRLTLDRHPPADYPKLYPRPIEHYRIGIAVFEWANRVILMFGAGLLFSLIFLVDHATFADDGHISEIWPALYGVLQFLPWLVLEMVGYRQLKMMREARTPSTRRADLRPRTLLNTVSPGLVFATIAIGIASVTFDFYAHDFDFSWADSMQRTVTLVFTNGFMAAVGAWHLHGRKQDPHQHPADRQRQISVQLTSLLFVSMTLSVFFISQAADDVIDLDSIEASLMSLYFATVASLSLGYSLSRLKLEDQNFEVYRNTPAAR